MKTILRLHNLNFYAYHGVLPHEKEIGNEFVVNIELEADLAKACQSDNLADTINYAQIYEIVKKEMTLPSQLIEHVAHRIYVAIKHQFPQITHLEIRLLKRNPPINGNVEASEFILKD